MTPTIELLLVEDNRIEARQAEHWLTSRAEVSIRVHWAQCLEAALTRLSQGGIDLVLLDLNLPDTQGLDTFERLRRGAADLPVVVLTGEYDESIGIKAVQAGAEDYLVKQQVDGAKLAKVVQYAVARHQVYQQRARQMGSPSQSRVISLLGAKGGVGTSTLAINVATAIADMGKSVILAELKPSFGSLALSLQCEPTSSLAKLLEIPGEQLDRRRIEAVLSQGPSGSRLLFASHAEKGAGELDAKQAEAIIRELSRLADIVILDLPNWPATTTMIAARLSHYVGLVTAREPLAVRCGQAAVAALHGCGVSGGLVGAIVVGQSELPLSMDTATIRAMLGCDLLGVVPPAAAACHKAYVDAVPLVLSHPEDVTAEAYRSIAKTLTDRRGIQVEAA